MIRITIDGHVADLNEGTTVLEAIRALAPEQAEKALGALCGGRSLELNFRLKHSGALKPLYYEDDEGRRIYERTLRFVLLLAARRVLPDQRVRMEHSLGHGVYVTTPGHEITQEELALLENAMRDVVREDLPFVKERWSRKKAAQYFTQTGQTDTVRLLSYRPYDHYYMYHCGGMTEYYYGNMLPSTGYVPVFALSQASPGFVLQLPRPDRPDTPSAQVIWPKHMAAFQQSNEWCRILSCTNAPDVNDLIVSGRYRHFIRVNEALQDKSIAALADGIQARDSRAVFIAGPSSSGKTTFANRLAIHLSVLGLSPFLISLDNFYRCRQEIPVKADGSYDFEDLNALDIPLFHDCMKRLIGGEEVRLPEYDFTTGQSRRKKTPMKLSEGQLILIEGIHGLNPALHSAFAPGDISRVYISELTCINLDDHNRIRTTDARLLRRIVRDYQFRGTPPNETMTMWANVREGEETWIFPYQEQADFVFNSVLHYELPVLRSIAYDLLTAIEPDNPNYLLSKRLIKLLNYFIPAGAELWDEIPPLSILREFIGGNTLYK
ncbi:MAG: nucleoside kinase [Clostridia bacterium]|nr:nucleoside kinase [Clostridia bacterium]